MNPPPLHRSPLRCAPPSGASLPAAHRPAPADHATAPAAPSAWIDDDPGVTVPTAAGAFNAMYGGFHTNSASRQLATDLARAWPPILDHACAGRTLLRRMVRYLIAAGIAQFLDIGGGAAQHGATHEIITDTITDPGAPPDPDPASPAGPARRARLVYIDLDPIITDVNQHHLHDVRWATAVVGDLRQPHSFLNDPAVNDVLDLGRPVAVLLLGVLHHLPPEPRPGHALHAIADALSPGSYLAVTHLTTDPDPHGAAAQQHAADLLARTRHRCTCARPRPSPTCCSTRRYRACSSSHPASSPPTAGTPTPTTSQPRPHRTC
ncbi:SAM-dependent methyltransferase [Dactylosporangium sp. McL0621]|uniref:SAM-dependent methyltransferase n=1 Tax=Dactylosporangium sp. McL0621 TaxID=3415678 RepID=UPI003CF26846